MYDHRPVISWAYICCLIRLNAITKHSAVYIISFLKVYFVFKKFPFKIFTLAWHLVVQSNTEKGQFSCTNLSQQSQSSEDVIPLCQTN